jgi:chemotaxis protein histidine kinase CheA
MKADAKKAAEKSTVTPKEKDEAAKKAAAEKKAQEQKNQQEERKKKKASNKKSEAPKKEEAPKAQVSVDLKPCQEIDIYRVCEFSVHQFDLEAKQHLHLEAYQNMPDCDLLKEPLC